MWLRKIVFALAFVFSICISAQENPIITYSANPKEYEIANISISGAPAYDDYIIITFSELKVGQRIQIPGDEITAAVKRFWKQGLFSDVKISVEKFEGDKVWLHIALGQLKKISDVKYTGIKDTDVEDIEAAVGLEKGSQLTQNVINRAKTVVKGHMEDKGYPDAEVTITEEEDNTKPNAVIVRVDVDKKSKVKVKHIYVQGNDNLSIGKIDKAMKATHRSWRLFNTFKSKKFVEHSYQDDKLLVIEKYNEIGYRDAEIISDSIVRLKKNKVDVYLKVNEGKKYYFGDIRWVGNTIYTSEVLSRNLRIKKGDVYNAKLLEERVSVDEDALANLYQDNGYLFSNIDPVEVSVNGDSIDFEMRIYEGRQATINRIEITGNTRVYEHVVRRELRTKPGQLYSKSDIMRSLRELAQMGHFDPEKLVPDIKPDPENGTVDITYQLETKASDQVELSAGYGATGIIGSLGLKFSNFAIQNIFRPETYKIVPQGEGQTFSLKAQTNGSYYTSMSASFLDPWFGGKRPNALSLNVFYSLQSGVSNRYSSSYDYYAAQTYGSSYGVEIDPEQYLNTFGVNLGFGKRLSWPDDYFQLAINASYQNYDLMNWKYFIMETGFSNNFNIGLTLSRNSIDNPIYTRSGSSFSLSVNSTPPFSLFNDTDYSAKTITNAEKYHWLEYHKWKFKAKLFTPLSRDNKVVLMTRAEYGFLGYYDKNRRSPFETFYMGGDGMTGTYSSYATDIVGLRGYSNGSLTPYSDGGQNGNLYTRLSLELRYPIMLEGSTTIFALLFAEGGNCWSEFDQFNPFSLKRSAGVGVRLFLPMFGMMGVDWGYGFDTVAGQPSASGSQFAFTLGQEF